MLRRPGLAAALVAAPLLILATAPSLGGGRREERPPRLTTPAPTAPAAPTVATPVSVTPPPTSSPTGEPLAADDPVGLGRQLAAAEAAVADPATPPAVLASMAHLQQVAYRKLVARPEWAPEVLAALPAPFVAAAQANLTAGLELRSMMRKPKERLPPWRIVAPAPAAELLGYYKEAESQTGVPWQYLAAIHLVETRMGRIRGTSTAGAQGPMQFLPATWAAYGRGDINSNRDAIAAAARYLNRNGAPGDMRRALWNYNHDFRYVDAVTLHAQRMVADERAFYGYHLWQVYYFTAHGDVWLPEGYGSG